MATILLIDEDTHRRRQSVEELRRDGHVVVSTADSEHIVEHVDAAAPDVLILGHAIDALRAIAACLCLRWTATTSAVPVLMLGEGEDLSSVRHMLPIVAAVPGGLWIG